MKRIKKNGVYFIVLTLMFSCAKKAEFTQEEFLWLDVYNENDLLVFQNTSTLETDTTTIVKKEIYYPGYDWLQNDKYEPHIANIWYKNKKYPDTLDVKIIEMEKRNPNTKTFPLIKYLNTTFFVRNYDLRENHETLSISGKNFDRVYSFVKEKHERHRKDQDKNPQALYWDKGYGIIKYITYDGEVWERINW